MLRIGSGYDIHCLVENRPLIIGGVTIPSTKGLLGHSDADVLLHALMDALIGAAALGDIGKFFPDTEKEYQGSDSKILLQKVYTIIKELGYKINNIDSTIILEQPKLSQYIDPMREVIAQILGLRLEQISIKAKTNEGQDSVGMQNAASAYAVVLLMK
jgi:2-C-methyl-D-erythritol 2,4-cyclodiphosphate synthase